ncbi:hypothetical protein Ciccas_010765, partial [Cichlidogyrus casuarinus]
MVHRTSLFAKFINDYLRKQIRGVTRFYRHLALAIQHWEPFKHSLEIKTLALIVKGPTSDASWHKGGKRLMANLERFYNEMQTFDENELTDQTLRLLENQVNKASFSAETMIFKMRLFCDQNFSVEGSKTSLEMKGLFTPSDPMIEHVCDSLKQLTLWVECVAKYNHILYQQAKPLAIRVKQSKDTLVTAEKRLETFQRNSSSLQTRILQLHSDYEAAIVQRNDQVTKIDALGTRLARMQSRIDEIASELNRVEAIVESFPVLEEFLPVKCILLAATVTYLAPLDDQLRRALIEKVWPEVIKNHSGVVCFETYCPVNGYMPKLVISKCHIRRFSKQPLKNLVTPTEDLSEASVAEAQFCRVPHTELSYRNMIHSITTELVSNRSISDKLRCIPLSLDEQLSSSIAVFESNLGARLIFSETNDLQQVAERVQRPEQGQDFSDVRQVLLMQSGPQLSTLEWRFASQIIEALDCCFLRSVQKAWTLLNKLESQLLIVTDQIYRQMVTQTAGIDPLKKKQALLLKMRSRIREKIDSVEVPYMQQISTKLASIIAQINLLFTCYRRMNPLFCFNNTHLVEMIKRSLQDDGREMVVKEEEEIA